MNIFQNNFSELYNLDDSFFSVFNLSGFANFLKKTNPLVVFGSGSSYVVARFVSEAANWEYGVIAYALQTRQLIYSNIQKVEDLLLISYSGTIREIQNYDYILSRTSLLTVSPSSASYNIKSIFYSFEHWNRLEGFNASEAILIPCLFCYQSITNCKFNLSNSIDYWSSFFRNRFLEKERFHFAVFYGDYCGSAALDVKVILEESSLGMASLYEKREFSHGKFISFQNYTYDYVFYFCQCEISDYEEDLMRFLRQKYNDKFIEIRSKFSLLDASLDLLIAVQCLFYELSKTTNYDFSSPLTDREYLPLFKTDYPSF